MKLAVMGLSQDQIHALLDLTALVDDPELALAEARDKLRAGLIALGGVR